MTMGAANLLKSGRMPSANTARIYQRWIEDWTDWCQQAGHPSLPATPEGLAEYVAALGVRGKREPTIYVAVAAVRFLHAGAGYDGQPATDLAGIITRSQGMQRNDAGQRGAKSLPILLDDLRVMVETCDVESPRGQRDRLILLLGWSTMKRRSDLASCRLIDIACTADGLTVGEIPVMRGSDPRTDPVQAWESWVKTLANEWHRRRATLPFHWSGWPYR
jgi:site-specific recombinase XerD